MTSEISKQRIERAVRAGRSARVKASSKVEPEANYEPTEGELIFMSAALTADAPEIAAAELRGRIAGMKEARDGIERLRETYGTSTALAAIDSRIATLQAEMEKAKP